MVKVNSLDEVLKVNEFVVVEFTGPNCAACKQMKKILEKLEGMYDDIAFCEVDVEESPAVASQFYVMSVPMTLILVNGIVFDQIEGAVGMSKIEDRLLALRRMS